MGVELFTEFRMFVTLQVTMQDLPAWVALHAWSWTEIRRAGKVHTRAHIHTQT